MQFTAHNLSAPNFGNRDAKRIGEGGGQDLKNLLLYASMAALLGSMMAAGQEKNAGVVLVPVYFPTQQQWAFSPDDMRTVGTLDSGETSKPMEFSQTPKYRAFVFEGKGHDRVVITVAGPGQKAYVALADSTLTPIASGLGSLSVTLPYHGPDTEAFYILIKNLASQPSRLTVHLEKTPAVPQPAAYTTR
jgi:hypothetical protein